MFFQLSSIVPLFHSKLLRLRSAAPAAAAAAAVAAAAAAAV